MNLIKFLDDFLADIDSDNLFLSVLPAFYALFTIDSVFNCDYKCCGIMFWAVLFLHLKYVSAISAILYRSLCL